MSLILHDLTDAEIFTVVRRALEVRRPPGRLATELHHALRIELNLDAPGADILGEIERRTRQAFATNDTVDDRAWGQLSCRIELAGWFSWADAAPNESWSHGTPPNSERRRQRIYEEIGLDAARIAEYDIWFPPVINRAGDVLIAVEQTPWYDEARKRRTDFYGASILRYLKEQRGWSDESCGEIDQNTDLVIDRLADPDWVDDRNRTGQVVAARGLVVGYVQSGKTTNINLLVAKAIDVGYRLIIILAGTTNLLRSQTQRRVDKEVIGKRLVADDPAEREANGYPFHDDWEHFIEHSPKPGGPPTGRQIERLTTRSVDFTTAPGLHPFTEDWVTNGRSTKVVVIKKNQAPLQKLNREIALLSEALRTKVMALVIDDESDQASINTKRPEIVKDDDDPNERSRINDEIVKLLLQLRRAQYVGFTATPYSNVFIDPDVPEDLFPRDFVLALGEPRDYMGPRKFHDLDEDFNPIELPESESNRARHVRDLFGHGHPNIELPDPDELLLALDCYLLAGALKLYRRSVNHRLTFKHHTFFYTDSVNRDQHEVAKREIERVWRTVANYSTRQGHDRLKRVYETDMSLRSPHKDSREHFPATYADLLPFIDQALQMIDAPINGRSLVLVVNSSDSNDAPDYEVAPVWKCIIGGAKLARGYTIEGLTTTFFRRVSLQVSTLMQMGRWFGYRPHYEDLVRLFIRRNAPKGNGVIDLYEEFESICRDEASFRMELRKYRDAGINGRRLLPGQIPPLVQVRSPKMMPVGRNHMWNAELKAQNYGDQFHGMYSFLYSPADRRQNEDNLRSFLEQAHHRMPLQSCDWNSDESRRAWVTICDHASVIDFLTRHRDVTTPERVRLLDFLKGDLHEIDDWVIAIPQQQPTFVWNGPAGLVIDGRERSQRGGIEDDMCRLVTLANEPERVSGRYIANESAFMDRVGRKHGAPSPTARNHHRQRGRGVLFVYVVRMKDVALGETPFIGLEMSIPKNSQPTLTWGVRNPRHKGVVVRASSQGATAPH
jgi:hypothetical protein